MGINVGKQPDLNANQFFEATEVLNLTQRQAVYDLVKDLKFYNLWDKMKAIYPMVGQSGVSSSFQFNLKDINTFKGTFSGSWTYSSTGILPSNAYMDTGVNIQNNLSQNNTHVSIYSRTDNSSLTVIFGASSGSDGRGVYLLPRLVTNGYLNMFSTGGANAVSSTNSLGLRIVNRINNTTVNYYTNNTSKQNLSLTSTTGVNYTLYLGANNNAGTPENYSNREIAFASIGDGLTDTEAANLYTAVQRFQTTLGRQV